MRNLGEFLELAEVKNGIDTNIKPYQNENSVIEKMLYYSKEKCMYLVEIRIFNNGNMDNAYLDIFNSTMEHFDEYQDDVWSFTDWKELFECFNCGETMELTNATNDELGWHTSCTECGSSFDVDIEKYIIPNGTKVKVSDDWIGIVDGNDAVDTDNFQDINYYVCPIEFFHEEIWSNHYKMVLRKDISVIV